MPLPASRAPRPTTLAVSDAITHYRQLRQLTIDELSHVLAGQGHAITADRLSQFERRERVVDVDDLMAIACALDVSPAVLLSHIPIDMPHPEGPLATGVPADVEALELREWAHGRTALDQASRLGWWEERVTSLRIRSSHCEEQLQGAYAEARELGDLMQQEAEALPVQRLEDRIRSSEHDLHQTDLALALAQHRLDCLREQC